MGTTTSSDISQALPKAPQRTSRPFPVAARWPLTNLLILLAFWLAIFVAALAGPPLLDDADSTHAQAAQAMLQTGDYVTLHVDGIRYLEKPPLPYWIAALCLRLFPSHAAFAVHLPLALTVLGLALLGYGWTRRAFPSPRGNDRAALYCGVFILTSAGTFLFTRIFIPDALLSLLLAIALYALLRSLEPPTPYPVILSGGTRSSSRVPQSKDPRSPSRSTTSNPFLATIHKDRLHPHLLWLSLALAVLTKGLVALVFFFGTALLFLALTGEFKNWRRLRPFSGVLLFLAVAAPWHLLAGLRNTGAADGHGFFWFYFVNEHVLRFLGRRIPRDYNKLPFALYWSLHLVWLFPWSLFVPTALVTAWRNRSSLFPIRENASSRAGEDASSRLGKNLLSRPEARTLRRSGERGPQRAFFARWGAETPVFRDADPATEAFQQRTVLLLLIFSTLVLIFFSLSTNQEYYTLPVYLPLLMLLAAALTADSSSLFPLPFALFFLVSLTISIALTYGLWTSRHLPFQPDIGNLLAHRGIGDYTLSMSHFFDLTGPSFAALRLPASLAALTFALGPLAAWILHYRRKPFAAVMTVALTSTAFLIAAHIALLRFAPMLSSQAFAATIQRLQQQKRIDPDTRILLYGDQAYGSSIPFYLHQQVFLVDGRSTSMLFGSTFPDAPSIFLTGEDLRAQWGTGPRKVLFVPLELRDQVEHLLGPDKILLQEESGKALFTDRPLPHWKTGQLEN
jgi:4-amino-4-deoxy-L-arabinose transferase-like glycosyltransferase